MPVTAIMYPRTFVVRHSAVVEDPFQLARVQREPRAADWWEAGRLIQVLGDARGWNPAKLAGRLPISVLPV